MNKVLIFALTFIAAVFTIAIGILVHSRAPNSILLPLCSVPAIWLTCLWLIALEICCPSDTPVKPAPLRGHAYRRAVLDLATSRVDYNSHKFNALAGALCTYEEVLCVLSTEERTDENFAWEVETCREVIRHLPEFASTDVAYALSAEWVSEDEKAQA